MSRTAYLLAASALLAGCTDAEPVATGAYSLQLGGVCTDAAGSVHMTASLSDDAGEPVSLAGSAKVTIETRAKGSSSWHELDGASVTVGGAPRIDLALVADNSSSETAALPAIQSASKAFAHAVLGHGPSNRVGVVRVSTTAKVMQDPTSDGAEVDAAVDAMFITNGWTALWDGVRLGKEILEDSPETEACGRVSPAIVLFTDGRDNNSSHEHATAIADDGVDTSASDLAALAQSGVGTPIHVVGVGTDVDESALAALASATGGRYVSIEGYAELQGALDVVEDDVTGALPLTFRLDDCAAQVRVTVALKDRTVTAIEALPDGC